MHKSETNNSQKAFSGAMPDTTGLNFFEEDHNLKFLLHRYLSSEEFKCAEPNLSKLGADAGSKLDQLSRTADKHTPELISYNSKGERIDEIEFNNAYLQMEQMGYGKYSLVAMSHKEGVLGWPKEFPYVLKYAFWYLFAQSEFGLLCPMSMTDSAARILEKFASPSMQEKYLPLLTSTDMDEFWTAAQFMTEKQGGSDVGANTTTATYVGDHWEISGDKWFCSNPTADVVLVLARTENALPGTKGLGLFLVPRKLNDGTLNNYRINRLKDKLGTRDMASGELTFEGATAHVVGDISNGFKQMMEMVNSARLSNAVRSTGMIRRSFLESIKYAQGRLAFGRPLSELPLMTETLFELLLDSEASTAMVLHTAQVYHESENGEERESALLRILTPLLKGYICKRARYLTAEAMEVRGGNGYIEDWVNPKLVRDAHVGSIWEGTTNILALDILRAFTKNKVDDLFFNDIYERLSGMNDPLVKRVSDLLQKITDKTHEQTIHVLELEGSARELPAKQLMYRLYHIYAASLLLGESEHLVDQQQSYRKLYLLVEYLNRYLLSNGFNEITVSDQSLLEWFEDIVAWERIPERAVEPLLRKVESYYF